VASYSLLPQKQAVQMDSALPEPELLAGGGLTTELQPTGTADEVINQPDFCSSKKSRACISSSLSSIHPVSLG
jgi:hypothetical protein